MSKREKPLSLSRETVRELSDQAGLAEVAGGVMTLSCNQPTTCTQRICTAISEAFASCPFASCKIC